MAGVDVDTHEELVDTGEHVEVALGAHVVDDSGLQAVGPGVDDRHVRGGLMGRAVDEAVAVPVVGLGGVGGEDHTRTQESKGEGEDGEKTSHRCFWPPLEPLVLDWPVDRVALSTASWRGCLLAPWASWFWGVELLHHAMVVPPYCSAAVENWSPERQSAYGEDCRSGYASGGVFVRSGGRTRRP